MPDVDKYPFNLQLVHRTAQIDLDQPVTLFSGENGSGKSTVLKAICLKCGIHIWRPEEGRRINYNPLEEHLYRYVDVEWANGRVPGSYFASQTFQYFTEFLEDCAVATPEFLEYFGGTSLMDRSHGQSLIKYFEARYRIKGLYLLDEPETALSPRSQIRLLQVIAGQCRLRHAQFIIATHSPILLACPGALIYSFDVIPPRVIEYEQTDNFRIYKDFMKNRLRYLEDII